MDRERTREVKNALEKEFPYKEFGFVFVGEEKGQWVINVGKATLTLPEETTIKEMTAELKFELDLQKEAQQIAEIHPTPLWWGGDMVSTERWIAHLAKAIKNNVQSARIWSEEGPFGKEIRAEIDGKRVTADLYAKAASVVCAARRQRGI